MNEIIVKNENSSFLIRFYNFGHCASVDCLQFNFEFVSPIFMVSTTRNVSMEELLLFRKDLDLMFRKCYKEVSFIPLGEFFSLRFQLKEKEIIHLHGCIYDTQMPQSSLNFYHTIHVGSLPVILTQIDHLINNFNRI